MLSNLPSMDFRQHPELLKDLLPWSDYMRSRFELQQKTRQASPFGEVYLILSSGLFCSGPLFSGDRAKVD